MKVAVVGHIAKKLELARMLNCSECAKSCHLHSSIRISSVHVNSLRPSMEEIESGTPASTSRA